MKNFLVFFFYIIVANTYLKADVITGNGEITPPAIKIFSYFKGYIPEDCYKEAFNNRNNPAVETLNDLAQKYFLRPKGSERADAISMAHYQKLYSHLKEREWEEIIQLFRELGHIDAVYPKIKSPDYILIQGSTVPSMRERVTFLAELIEQGYIDLKPTTKIVFHIGERKLFASETKEVLLNPAPYKLREGWQAPAHLPFDERQAAPMVWEQLELPKSLRTAQVEFFGVEKRPGEQRAQTQDCADGWFSKPDLPGGYCLIISGNPYVNYQKRVIEKAILKSKREQDFTVEAAGRAAPVTKYSKEMALGVLLDNLARILYTEKQIIELKAKAEK